MNNSNILSDFSKNPIFQIIDWHSEDCTMEELGKFNNLIKTKSTSDKLDLKLCNWWNWWKNASFKNRREFTIYAFGRNQEGLSVSTEIRGFNPYFYINIPNDWNKTSQEIDILKEWILKNVWCKMYPMPKKLNDDNYSIGDDQDRNCEDRWKTFYNWIQKDFKTLKEFHDIIGIIKIKFHRKYKLQGFTNNKKFNFLEIRTTNMRTFYTCRNIFQNKFYDSNNDEMVPHPKQITIQNLVKNHVFDLFESNINPIIRFIHYSDILPCGWVKVNNFSVKFKENKKTYSNIEIGISIDDIQLLNKNNNAQIPIAFYDIECDSSHGDFPQAKKNYKSVAREIMAEYSKTYGKTQNIKISDLERNKAYEYLKKAHFFTKLLLESIYENGNNDHNISKVYWKTNKQKVKMNSSCSQNKEKKYLDLKNKQEKNEMKFVNDHLSIIKNCNSVKNYINLIDEVYKVINKNSPRFKSIAIFNLEYPKIKFFKRFRDELISTVAKKIHPLININYNKLGLSKLEINKLRSKKLDDTQFIMDKYLVPIEGDPIIQIGTCFLKYGDKKPYKKHILTLNTCDDIEGVEVVSCETEKELILKWQKLIIDENPDVISGYNIYSFDFPYIWDRAVELGQIEKFRVIGKFKNRKSRIKEKILSSSALGHNSWREIDTIGRIQVDLLKVIQRDHNLPSYKLDNVSSHFMKGKVINIIKDEEEYSIIETDNVKGIQKDSYIKFIFMDGHSVEKHNNGHKYYIENIENNRIIIRGTLNFLKKNKYNWCMAKDDVSPKDIFRFQKEGSDKRCIIAKYCVKDVILCVELLQKLEIMTNNIGMSNVCFTPLLWIFTRGQGVKIFSLVSKQCRKDNFLVPVLYKDKNASGYEGAIVLNPNPGIYLEYPVSVMDYASLYPSCMISENLSHDSIVTQDEWLGEKGGENLKKMGYEYVDIIYDQFKYINKKKTKTGVKTCRFIQPKKEDDGTIKTQNRAIIPRILNKLLKARKQTRKKIPYKIVELTNSEIIEGLMKKNNNGYNIIKEDGSKLFVKEDEIIQIKDKYNQFDKAVLDGLQLAYKMTANSIYGQMGASTSPIRWIDIAASTTAKGRDLLKQAGNFVTKKYNNVWFNENVFIKETKLVYGDSVTGDTPLVLKKNGKVFIKTIESLNNEWKPYEEFKPFDSNRREKQQTKTSYKIWTNGKWANIKRVIRHKTKKNIFRINTSQGIVDVTEDHSLINSKFQKIKPNECIVGKTELAHSFPTNFKENNHNNCYYDDFEIINGSFLERQNWINDRTSTHFDFENGDKLLIKHKLVAQVYYYIIKSIGIDISVNYNPTKNTYEIYKSKENVNPKIIKQIINLGNYDGIVYDIETDEGYFNGGIGEIILKNTDSVFVRYVMEDKCGNSIKNKEALKLSIEISVHAEKKFKKLLKEPHNLEYEKTFWPFILFSKKRYVGNKYEFKTNCYKQTSMGIVLKRRDNAPIVKYVYGGVIDIIMNHLDINKSIDFLQVSIRDILNGTFKIDKFVITKSLRSHYKDPQRIAHKVLADRIGERDPGNKPKPNDRVPYVYINKPTFISVKETYIKLTNKKFGKYFLIYSICVSKNKSEEKLVPFTEFTRQTKNKYKLIQIIEITDKKGYEKLKKLEELTKINTKLETEIDWDWDENKNKGYSLEWTSNNAILNNLCKKRLTKEPILNITKNYGKEENTLKQFVEEYTKTAESKGQKTQIKFHKNLFDKKQIQIKKKTLQGDRIENPKYIVDNKIPIDYKLYITNQIMKPVCQIYGLIVERLDKKYKFPYDKNYYTKKYKKIRKEKDEIKTIKKIRDMKEKMAKELLFMPIIRQIERRDAMIMWNGFGFTAK